MSVNSLSFFFMNPSPSALSLIPVHHLTRFTYYRGPACLEGYICAGRIGDGSHETISIRFKTSFTPGAPQAARSASFTSAHDLTLPDKVTVPPLASTLIC